jgi:hypothetical protein
MGSTSKKYEIHSGRRLVSTQYSVSPLQAVVDYVRSYGVKDDEITRLGVDSVSWRGARFKAVLVPTAPLDAMRVAGMTPEQRDSLRKEIDVRVRERMGGVSKRGGSPPGSKLPLIARPRRAAE